MEMKEIRFDGLAEKAETLAVEGKTCVFIADGNQAIGLIGLADVPRESAKETLTTLKNMGLKVALVTGDNMNTGRAIGGVLGIDHVMADVLPGDKATEIKTTARTGRGCCHGRRRH